MNNAANDALTAVESAGPLRAAQGTIMGAELSYWRDAMREELQMPSGLLVGTGHQVEWWHPGIAAKFMWANAVAARLSHQRHGASGALRSICAWHWRQDL